jgi:hypothetical protein
MGAWLAREEAGTSNTASAPKYRLREQARLPRKSLLPSNKHRPGPHTQGSVCRNALHHIACDQNIEPSKMKN